MFDSIVYDPELCTRPQQSASSWIEINILPSPLHYLSTLCNSRRARRKFHCCAVFWQKQFIFCCVYDLREGGDGFARKFPKNGGGKCCNCFSILKVECVGLCNSAIQWKIQISDWINLKFVIKSKLKLYFWSFQVC